MVTLLVWYKGEKRDRKLEVTVESHQEASRLARGLYAGMRTKIIDKNQRRYPREMKSYSDMMEVRGGY